MSISSPSTAVSSPRFVQSMLRSYPSFLRLCENNFAYATVRVELDAEFSKETLILTLSTCLKTRGPLFSSCPIVNCFVPGEGFYSLKNRDSYNIKKIGVTVRSQGL